MSLSLIFGGGLPTLVRLAKDVAPAQPIVSPFQQASIGTTALFTHAAGDTYNMYRVSYYIQISQAATTSSSVVLTLSWNDSQGGPRTKTSATITANTVGTIDSGSFVVMLRSGSNAISYSTTYSSVGATPMQYELDLAIEDLT